MHDEVAARHPQPPHNPLITRDPQRSNDGQTHTSQRQAAVDHMTRGSESAAAVRSFTPGVMREVLGSFCSSVVVVSAVGDEPLGFTCQSFVSLSLDPPLVSFSPARTSTTWPRIRKVGAFCVNVLAENQSELSAKFARSGTDKYVGVDWTPSPKGSPILGGVVAWIDCTLWAEHEGGDHTIAVGEVHGLASDLQQHPLLFYRSNYLERQFTPGQPL